MTVSGGCVVGWYPDESVKGPTNLKPVTCETVIYSLRAIIGKLALGVDLGTEETDIVEALAADYLAEVTAATQHLMDEFLAQRQTPPLRIVTEGSA